MANTEHKYGPITDTMDIIKTHKKKKKTYEHDRKISYTQIVQKQLTHERQRHRGQQPYIQNTTRNKQQIAAQNRQTTRKGKRTHKNQKINEKNTSK
jgi:hypothetical protein